MKKDKSKKWNYSVGKEIRQSMKEVIREHGTKYWFKEVFWPHYGKLSIALVVALIVAIVLTVEAANKPQYDFHMVVAMDDFITYDDTEELRNVIAPAVGDVNGDGKILLDVQVISLSDPENLEVNQQRLQLAFAQYEYTLYILDEQYSATYCHREYFDPIADYGFAADPDEPRRMNVSDVPLMQRLGKQVPGDLPFYACICDWTVDGKGDKDLTDAAVRALSAIIEAE
ncbi:MAG: hypothetical protein IKT47_06475 [Oscillospiraceae bacterium]|nr:hypothetical protein [Oscillospiraceae bacterium]